MIECASMFPLDLHVYNSLGCVLKSAEMAEAFQTFRPSTEYGLVEFFLIILLTIKLYQPFVEGVVVCSLSHSSVTVLII